MQADPSSYTQPMSARKKLKLSVDYEALDFDTDLAQVGETSGNILLEEDEPLSWSLSDVPGNLSDWTIVVTEGGGLGGTCAGTSTSASHYHVHKNILAVGPRKSEYFSHLFLSTTSFVESNNSRSTIELEPSAAAAFPIMLDYVYNIGNLELSTEHAIALRHLSKYFGIHKLFVEVANFIRRDLTAETATFYLKEASLYCDDKVLRVTCRICAANAETVNLKRFLVSFDSEQFLLISSFLKLFVSSEIMSTYVAEYFRSHKEATKNPCFNDLTNNKIIPRIDSSEAIFFLSLPMTKVLSSNESTHEPSLQNRCIASCSKNWKSVLADPIKAHASDSLQLPGSAPLPEIGQLCPLVQVKLLQSALCAADAALAKKDVETRDIVSKKDAEIRDLHVLVKDLQEIHCDIMERERGNKLSN
uniref:BTB domain-containing protein n=1 Tax=Ditylum brightwellii TaxID=49249 RepID=A0A7S4W3D4_9STRA